MKSIIVNLKNEIDLYEKYNNDVSRALIDYLIREANTRDDVEIVINTKLNIENIDNLIKKGLKEAYNDSERIDKLYDNKQIMFFIIGVVFLIFSTFIRYEIIKEIIVIAGWVGIWEVVDISLNLDSTQRINRKIIKKLINCKIKVNKI